MITIYFFGDTTSREPDILLARYASLPLGTSNLQQYYPSEYPLSSIDLPSRDTHYCCRQQTTGMFGQQTASALNTTTPAAPNPQPNNPAGQTGQTGMQPSLFSGFGQQQSQPTQSLFGNLTQPQQQQQPPANQSGAAPSLFGSSTLNASQPPTTGGTPAFGGASWNSGNPLLPKSAFGAGTPMGQAQNGTGLGTSLFGQQSQQQQQQQQQNTGFGSSFLAPTQNQTQQTWGVYFVIFLSLTMD